VRCGCCACFFVINHIKNGSLWVTWFWEHNHEPNSVSQMINGQISVQLDKWLTDRVDAGMKWSQIGRLIKTPNILNVSYFKSVSHCLHLQLRLITSLLNVVDDI
jgi:hypothetical protein